MNHLRYLFLFLVFLLLALPANAQRVKDYSSSVGLRVGTPTAVSYKGYFNQRHAAEVYVGYRSYDVSRYISVNAAYLSHQQIESLRGLKYYVGAGPGVRRWSYDFSESGATVVTASAYVGLEYDIPRIPVSVSADWVPTYFFGRDGGSGTFGYDLGGLGVRYRFAGAYDYDDE
ncbi:hypothetical protein GGR26_002491 [Lewinella marina]|uniref:Outer membrane protein beta-barrel domain-containing protein n=1 Tax=Neolewinella marina TaxID=438751 RepID=A0A2G0CC30_9BACT|nr:hypothetical protein [Neolewinella marina]NJB86714.1 hypothetical protein [Neolewinella marina]PHK97521.1 hypothetical protein CGL56_15595 [Neolewinella marina]